MYSRKPLVYLHITIFERLSPYEIVNMVNSL